ncbi:MAG: LysO family transporter [Acidaminobacteraceae bacterium]
MGIIFFALLLGVLVGAMIKFNEKQVKIISQLQTLGVLVLLFVMGISVGVNPDIVSKLSEIGISSLVFAVLTTFMSVVVVYFVTTIYMRKEKAND